MTRLTVLASACPKWSSVRRFPCFFMLKMFTRAMVWGQVETGHCVARTIIASIYLIACIQAELSCSRKKRALKTSYNIFTTSLTKFEKQRFSRYLLLANVKSPWVRLWCLTYTGWSHMSHYKLLYPPVQIPDTLECDPRNDCVVWRCWIRLVWRELNNPLSEWGTYQAFALEQLRVPE